MAKVQKAAEGQVKARVLVDGAHGKVNDVVLIDAAQVESLAGVVDADPAAVEYAESLADAMPRRRLTREAKRWRQLICGLRVWATDRRNFLRCVVVDHYSIALFPEDITSRTNVQLRELLLERLAERPSKKFT